MSRTTVRWGGEQGGTMSFPSAIKHFENGLSAEDALFEAIKTDTNLGFAVLEALRDAVRSDVKDPVEFVRARLADRFDDEAAQTVLRAERRGRGWKLDIDPLSKVGLQVMRLMGTDAARPLLAERLGGHFGFANCCAPINSDDEKDTKFNAEDQIRWQHSIDC